VSFALKAQFDKLHISLSSLSMSLVQGTGNLGLGPHLFVKVPRPGDSEVTFAVFESKSR